ncbi:hypothetical protein [Hyalangium versicolor]|uniref:hypothetical protein n=1 Tax=Hyalangium versicolor TaxID=2861190 RepID=UPI001CCCB920|nr:hypothetical protein [Hyalangium versicolor]
MGTQGSPRSGKKMARVNVPVLREVLQRLGSEKGIALVGECYDLVSSAALDAFDQLDVNPLLKSAARGPIEMVVAGGRGIVIDWAHKQLPNTQVPPQA